jgi:hypothetical protein
VAFILLGPTTTAPTGQPDFRGPPAQGLLTDAIRLCRVYLPSMKTFLAILVALLMLGTLGVLFAGLFGLVRGGGNPARSNRLMRWRIILQGAALLLFALLMSLLRS